MSYIITIGLSILFFIVCCVIHEIINYVLPNPNLSNGPILIITKNGGIAGLSYKLNIYDDKTYVLFSRGKDVKKGIIDNDKYENAKYLINQLPFMKDSYCKVDGVDMIYYGLESSSKIINLGSPETKKDCLPTDINKSLFNLSELMI